MKTVIFWEGKIVVKKMTEQAKTCKHKDMTLRHSAMYGLFQSCNACGLCFS